LPQYTFDGWFGLGAPAGVPRDILERLNAALNEALKDSAVRVRFEEIGAVPIGLELDKAKTFLVDEVVKYRDIITKAGIARIE
jgi:tripartite-type tricarboxylate transporter receptor subunit TctC